MRRKVGMSVSEYIRACMLMETVIDGEVAAFKREWEWCQDNPVSRVSLEKGATKRDRWLMEGEEARLLDVCPSWLRELVVFALHSGMRAARVRECCRGSR